jgi:dipeptidase E
MRLLLGSGGFLLDVTERRDFFSRHANAFLGDVRRILVIPYASIRHPDVTGRLNAVGSKLFGDRTLLDINSTPSTQQAVREAEAFLMWGGNTFVLLDRLHQSGLLDPIREKVGKGTPYFGVSAGTNVACPTIKTTNDMPVVHPSSLTALGLVPFQINPHYVEGRAAYRNAAGGLEEYAGETRADRLNEFHLVNDTPVVGLPESTFLMVQNGKITYHTDQPKPVCIFKRNQPPQKYLIQPETDLTAHLPW